MFTMPRSHRQAGKFMLTIILIVFLCRFTFRFISGRPLSGRRSTDATFLRKGTTKFDESDRLSPWAYLPEWKRAAVRLVSLGLLVLTVWAPIAGLIVTGTGVIAGLSYSGWRVWKFIKERSWSKRMRKHRSTYLGPMHRALAPVVGVSQSRRPESWLQIPPNFRDPDYGQDAPDDGADELDSDTAYGRKNGEIVVKLPGDMPADPDLQKRIHHTIAAKLGVLPGDLDVSWQLMGSDPEVRLRQIPRPPVKVGYAAIKDAIRQSRDGVIVFGSGPRGRIITIDLDNEAPHVGLSCGSGAGKSVALRLAIAQLLRQGCQVIVLDKKRTSQRWCKDLPGVEYCRTGDQMHKALIRASAEVERRAEIVDALPATDESMPDVGPRIAVIFEEQNIGMRVLTSYWKSIKESGDPNRSPALDALDNVLCAGREFKVHVVSVAQLFTVQACGGDPAARANYGIRILARATRKAWEMLAPEVGPHFPHKSKVKGRMHMVLNDEVTEVQVAFLTFQEARALAMEEAAPVTVPATWSTEEVRAATEVVAPEERRYTLAEASREGIVPKSPGALRMAKARAGDKWPTGQMRGNRETWTADELRSALALEGAGT